MSRSRFLFVLSFLFCMYTSTVHAADSSCDLVDEWGYSYDLNPLTNQIFSSQPFNKWQYNVSMCSNAIQCGYNGAFWSVIQGGPQDDICNAGLGQWNFSLPSVRKTKTGITIASRPGSPCNGNAANLRQARLNLMCNNDEHFVITSVVESPQCSYTINADTRYVCNPPRSKYIIQIGSETFDFKPMIGKTVIADSIQASPMTANMSFWGNDLECDGKKAWATGYNWFGNDTLSSCTHNFGKWNDSNPMNFNMSTRTDKETNLRIVDIFSVGNYCLNQTRKATMYVEAICDKHWTGREKGKSVMAVRKKVDQDKCMVRYQTWDLAFCNLPLW